MYQKYCFDFENNIIKDETSLQKCTILLVALLYQSFHSGCTLVSDKGLSVITTISKEKLAIVDTIFLDVCIHFPYCPKIENISDEVKCIFPLFLAYVKPKSITGHNKDIRHYKETSVQTVPKTLINEGITMSPSSLMHEEEDPYTDYKTIVRLQERPTRKVDIIQVEETRENGNDIVDGKSQYDRRDHENFINGQSKFTSHGSSSLPSSVPIKGVPGLYASVQPLTSRLQSAGRGSNGEIVNGIRGTNGVISEVEDNSEPSTVRSVKMFILSAKSSI